MEVFQEQILQNSGLLSPAAVPRGSSVGAVEQQAAVFAQCSGVRIFEKTKVPSAEWVEKIPPSTDEHAWVGRGWVGGGGSGALVKDIRACLFLMVVQTCNN